MPSDLRTTMRSFATGVCLATTYTDGPEGRCHDAVTVNSLTSVSLDPPLVSLSFRHESAFLADLLETKKWAVSILDGDAGEAARRFAKDRPFRTESLAGLAAAPGTQTGALVHGDGWLECRLWAAYEVGDHTMVVGEVLAAAAPEPGPALVFLHGGFHVLDRSPSAVR